jgi:hypothetical protein
MTIKVPAYSDDQLRSFSPSERHTIYKKARAHGTPEALELCERIRSLGLPYSEAAALKQNDPITMRIYEIAFTEAASSAMKAAIEAGQPPMIALDPLLVADLGVDYGPHNHSTNMAGRIAAERMEMFGFRRTGRKGPLPKTCIAKTAEIMERAS